MDTTTYQYVQHLHELRKIKRTARRPKYTHDLLCSCRRCEPGIITKWRKINVKELA